MKQTLLVATMLAACTHPHATPAPTPGPLLVRAPDHRQLAIDVASYSCDQALVYAHPVALDPALSSRGWVGMSDDLAIDSQDLCRDLPDGRASLMVTVFGSEGADWASLAGALEPFATYADAHGDLARGS